jgi:hypothetical protein
VRSALITHFHLPLGNGDIRRQIHEVAEDLAALGIGVARHPPGQQPVRPAGEDEER